MGDPKTWAEFRDVEKKVRDDARRKWLKKNFRRGESLNQFASRLKMDRGVAQRLLTELGILENFKAMRASERRPKKFKKAPKIVVPKPKERPPKVADLPEVDQKTYKTLRSELGISHVEALRRMLANKGVEK